MDIKINFSAWDGVFAVPQSLTDVHLKLATESQLKVLLYILRHNSKALTVTGISDAVCVHHSEVENAINFWAQRGLLMLDADSAPVVETKSVTAFVNEAPKEEVKKKVTLTSRLQRPDISYVASRISQDKELADLLNDIEFTLGKMLSSSDKATVVMMKETLGLPCEVIIMLVNYCASSGKANMRAIEKMAAGWSDKGIFTIEEADMMIKHLELSNNAWQKVSRIFGIKNIGLPTDAQLSYADMWCNEWKFSDDMLLEAYTRCVNTKGEYNIRYINGILKKWYNDKIFNLDDLSVTDAKTKDKKKNEKIDEDLILFKNKSLFND